MFEYFQVPAIIVTFRIGIHIEFSISINTTTFISLILAINYILNRIISISTYCLVL